MKAWYFSNTNCRLRYDDNRKIKAGATHTVDCEPILCESGLHGSIDIRAALTYAPGPYIWRVNLSGDIVRGDDKLVATSREYLWGYDATEVLRKFARLCALDVIHLWDAPDVVVRYLQTGDESLRGTARAAARGASYNVAHARANFKRLERKDAAGAAAYNAAGDTAYNAAYNAARAAAWDATGAGNWKIPFRRDGYAARAAARAAAKEKQSRRLYRMIMDERPEED
jgi:hypothetical protein